MVRSLRLGGRRRYGPGTAWERHNDRGGPSGDTAWSREPEGPRSPSRDQPEDGRQVEEAGLDGGCADRPEGAQLDGAVAGAGGDHRRLQASYATSARRPSLRATGHDSAADALVPAPMPAAAWHLTPAGRRGRHPKGGEANPGKQKFKPYPIGFLHIDIAEVRTEEGKLYLYVAVDRTSKFVFAELHDKADRPTAVAVPEALPRAVPYRLHTILTDNGLQFADLPKNRDGPPPACAFTASIRSAGPTASSIVSPSPPPPGPTARSNG